MRAGLYDILSGEFADGRPVDSVSEDDQYILSIVSNLNYLFNSRQGAIKHLPGYGLPDITEIYRDIPDSIQKLKQAIQKAVEEYEPRLKHIRVHYKETDSSSFRIVFILTASLLNDERVKFQTTFSSQEKAQVATQIR